MIIGYIVLGILAPIMLNLMHMIVGLYVVYINLDFRIYIPLLTFFWFFTHVVEAFVIQHYMNQNGSEYIKSVIRNFNKTVGV